MIPENNDKKYESFNDWYKEIKHLVWPFIIMVLIMILSFFLVKYFLP